MLKFANVAEQNQAYEYAINALKLLLESPEKKTDIDKIKYILARNYYRFGEFSDQEEQVKLPLIF